MLTDEELTTKMTRNNKSTAEGPTSFILPAQRSQWLTSALSHAYNHVSQTNINNEIVVLSTGIDQYIQEVFFHLGNRDRITGINGDGDAEPETISSEDFKILCQFLAAGEDSCVNDDSELECKDGDGIEFQEFHARLVDIFAEVGDDGCEVEDEGQGRGNQNRWRCDDEEVEAGINVPDRMGLVLRQMCTECFQQRPVLEVFHSVFYKQGKTPVLLSKAGGDNEEHNDIHTNNCSDQENCMSILARNEEVAILRAENNCLREVVEDMRRALQSCDAKCLAMLVEVKKLQQNNVHHHHQFIENCHKQKRSRSFDETESSRVVKLVREINKLRENRDKQLEEAMLFTQQLEADLWQEKQKKEVTEKCDKGVDATITPGTFLQDPISPNSASEDECGASPCSEGRVESSSESTSDDDSIITSIPSGDWCFPNSGDDYSPVTRVNIANLEIEMKELKETLRQVEFERDASLERSHQLTVDLDVETRGRKLDRRRYLDDITSLEYDRVRLSTIEEELGDIIVLIMRLRDMNFSKRSIGKILFDIINEGNFRSGKEGHDIENTVGSFIQSLHKELLHCDLMLTNGNMNPSLPSTTIGTNGNGSNLSAKNGVSLKTNFYQFNGDEDIQDADCDTPKRPNGFPVELIKSGFEMKC